MSPYRTFKLIILSYYVLCLKYKPKSSLDKDNFMKSEWVLHKSKGLFLIYVKPDQGFPQLTESLV